MTNSHSLTLINLGENIMTAINDFAVAQNGFNDQMDAAIAGLQADIKSLNDTIVVLQSSPGAISPADQASLDVLQARGKTMASKLNVLDALTPPAPPAA
jgi:hypothetical protein